MHTIPALSGFTRQSLFNYK